MVEVNVNEEMLLPVLELDRWQINREMLKKMKLSMASMDSLQDCLRFMERDGLIEHRQRVFAGQGHASRRPNEYRLTQAGADRKAELARPKPANDSLYGGVRADRRPIFTRCEYRPDRHRDD